MPWPLEFYRSSIGKKWVMAVTGIVWLVYVLTHMIGNLKVYQGFDAALGVFAVDEYGHALRELLHPYLPRHIGLWALRTVLIVSLILHIHAATALTLMNRRSRPAEYQGPREYLVANYASRTMRWSGVIVAAYILFHLADFTWGVEPFAPATWERGAVYANFVATFSRPVVAVIYIVANLLLGIHIFHGAWSIFQSLGWNHPRFNRWRRWFAEAFALVIVVGNVSFPVAVLAGWVQ